MKKIFSIMSIALAVLASSCTKQEEPGQESGATVITVKESDLKIPAKGGTARIVFDTNVKFEVSVDKEWCQPTVSGNTVKFTAAANESFNARYAKVVVKAAEKSLNFTVQQFGFYSSGFEPDNISTGKDAAVFDFAYEYDDQIEASTDAEWITLTISKDNLKVAIAENTTVGTPENAARTAEIAWKLGFETGVISVSQRNISFMNPDSNWDVNYEGIQDYQGEDVSVISNTVADATISGKYSIYYTTKAAFTDSGMEMDDFVMEVADVVRSEIYAVIDIYASIGYTLTFADFLYEESDYEIFDPIENGDYIAYAIGFDDNANLTGHYSVKDFKVQSGSGGGDNPGSGSDKYNRFLGSWSVDSGAFTIALTQNVADQSFYMRGWQMDQEFFEPANVLYEEGNIVLMADSNVPFASNVDIGADEGPCDMFYVGKFIYTDGKEYYITSDSAYDVATGVVQSDNSIKFSGNTFSLQGGGEFTFNRMEMIAVPVSDPEGGVYTFTSSKPNEFPLTAVKASGSSVKALGHRSGTWQKTEMRGIVINNTPALYDYCQKYEALPEMPARIRKHIRK